MFPRLVCGLASVFVRACGPAQSHPLAQRDIPHHFGVKDRRGPLILLRFLLLLRPKAKRFTEAFTPLGAGLIMEETRLGLASKSKITNIATPCNTVASIRSFLRGNEANEEFSPRNWNQGKANFT